MSPLVKFWIASTLLLFVLALWPLKQFGSSNSSSPGESEFAKEAALVDRFCLARIPTSGKASIPKAWEEALDIKINVLESAGEAAGDIGLPREESKLLTSLKPGEGILRSDGKEVHYAMKSAQGNDWFLVLTKKNGGGLISTSGKKSASPISLAIGFALVSGGLLTLLARVAFIGTPRTS